MNRVPGSHDGLAKASVSVSELKEIIGDRERFVEAVREGRFHRLHWVRFKIIDGCNIKCVMCNHWRRPHQRHVLSTARLLDLADELAALGAAYVAWSGGEPTLREDLPRIIGRYRELGIKSGVTTNGTRLTPEYSKALADARLRCARLSLESPVPEVHDRVVGVEGSWRKLVEGARHLSGHGTTRVTFQTVLTRLNLGPELLRIVDLAADVGASRVKFQPVVVSHLDDATLVPREDQLDRFREEYLPAMLEAGRRLGVEIRLEAGETSDVDEADGVVDEDHAGVNVIGVHPEHYYRTRTCYLPWYHCTIDFHGRVYPCCHMRDHEGKLGTIVSEDLVEIVRSAAARRLRRRLCSGDVPDACRTCTMQLAENQEIERLIGGTSAS